MEDNKISLRTFDDVLAFLELTAADLVAGKLEPGEVKARIALCAEARATSADKAKFQEALDRLNKTTKDLVGGKLLQGEPFSIPRLGGSPALAM